MIGVKCRGRGRSILDRESGPGQSPHDERESRKEVGKAREYRQWESGRI